MHNFNIGIGMKYREVFVVSTLKFLFCVCGTEEGENHIKIIGHN